MWRTASTILHIEHLSSCAWPVWATLYTCAYVYTCSTPVCIRWISSHAQQVVTHDIPDIWCGNTVSPLNDRWKLMTCDWQLLMAATVEGILSFAEKWKRPEDNPPIIARKPGHNYICSAVKRVRQVSAVESEQSEERLLAPPPTVVKGHKFSLSS